MKASADSINTQHATRGDAGHVSCNSPPVPHFARTIALHVNSGWMEREGGPRLEFGPAWPACSGRLLAEIVATCFKRFREFLALLEFLLCLLVGAEENAAIFRTTSLSDSA